MYNANDITLQNKFVNSVATEIASFSTNVLFTQVESNKQ